MNILILTASYGAGHNSAARALEEEFSRRGHHVHLADGLAIESSVSYPISRSFYQFCVNHAGWLWGLTYDITDRADWSRLVTGCFFKSSVAALRALMQSVQPDLVLCTYPLFSFFLDEMRRTDGTLKPFRHVAVVTDALEVSRPWLRSQAERIFMTDEYSARSVAERYALEGGRVVVSSFPTSSRFYPCLRLDAPSAESLRMLYSAQAPAAQCVAEIRALLRAYPKLSITLIAGKREAFFRSALADFCSEPRLQVIARSEQMDELMRRHHLYVGKPGGATMFECYASALPMLVNFALMGQEQGNLDLLQRDACASFSKGPQALLDALALLLAHDAREWKKRRACMLTLPRRNGAARVCDACEQLMSP